MKDLEQYSFLQKEIKELELELREILKKRICADIVTGSSPHFPYSKCNFQIVGLEEPTETERIKTEQLTRIIKNRHQRLLIERLKIENFINDIKYPDIRLIVTLRYIKGFRWIEVSRHVYDYPGKDRARIRLERYLQKINKL